MFVSHSLLETEKIAQNFLGKLVKENVATTILLSGDLGSGKTTFVKALGKLLGVTETIQSPTFVIMKQFPVTEGIFKKLVHIDAYRFENEKEASVLKLEALFADPDNLIMIEWPERIASFLPKDARKIHFSFIDKDTRQIIL